jgi:peptidoglycan/xylan/chitin deacetylase (PgdA/CDA1 family)
MAKQQLNTFFLKNRIRDFFLKKPVKSNLQILMYHRILQPGEMDFLSELGMVHTSTKNFKDHLQWFKDYNYNIINFDHLSEILSNGSALPPRTVIITFDDGSSDQYRNAVPLLKKFDFSATFFPIKNCVNGPGFFWLIEFYVYLNELGFRRVHDILKELPRLSDSVFIEERIPRIARVRRDIAFEFKYLFSPREKESGLKLLRDESTRSKADIAAVCQTYMNSDQLKELIKEGFEVGSHGVHHYPMCCLTREEKIIEIEKQWIEQLNPHGRKIFSLPFGSHSLSDFELFEEYDFVLTTKNETYNSDTGGHELGRFAVFDEPAKILSQRLIH